jgi:hypothetical protein
LRTSVDPATLQLVAAFDPRPVLAEVDRLRDALTTAGYTVDAVVGLLGPAASAALGRAQTTPALLTLAGDRSALATLVRLWPLQAEVALADVAATLPGLVAPMAAAGIVEVAGTSVRALVDIRPYGDEAHDWWVVCDLLHSLNGRSTPVPADHVPGVGGATTSLAQLTVRRPVGTALDLGTGCGVQAFHLTAQAGRVVATDVNRRALDMARLATALNGLADAVEYREGDFFAPVAGQRFDQVVSNPPFVVSPATADSAGGGRFAYRDAGFAGDELGELLLSRLPDHLAPGGTGQLLANWEHRSGADWRDRVGSWLAPLADAGAPTTPSGTQPGCGTSPTAASRASGSAGSACTRPATAGAAGRSASRSTPAPSPNRSGRRSVLGSTASPGWPARGRPTPACSPPGWRWRPESTSSGTPSPAPTTRLR